MANTATNKAVRKATVSVDGIRFSRKTLTIVRNGEKLVFPNERQYLLAKAMIAFNRQPLADTV